MATTVTGLSGPQFPCFQEGVGNLWAGSLTSLDVHHFTLCMPGSPLGILLMALCTQMRSSGPSQRGRERKLRRDGLPASPILPCLCALLQPGYYSGLGLRGTSPWVLGSDMGFLWLSSRVLGADHNLTLPGLCKAPWLSLEVRTSNFKSFLLFSLCLS